MTEFIASKIRDKLAITLSMICVVQCLALPVIISMMPLLDIWWLSDSVLHPFLLIFVIPLTFYTLVPAYRRHGSTFPLIVAVPGLLFLMAGAFMEQTLMEKVLTVIGACLVAVAHLRNIYLTRQIPCKA